MENSKSNRMFEIFIRSLRGESVSVKKLANEYRVSTKSISPDITEIQNFLAEHRELERVLKHKTCVQSNKYDII